MAATRSKIHYKDAYGNMYDIDAIDQSGVGTGPFNPMQGAVSTDFVDRSGTTSATPNTFTQIAAENRVRQYFRITNLSATATLYLWDKTGNPSGVGNCIAIPAGGGYVFDSRVSSAPLQVAASSASVAYEAAEG